MIASILKRCGLAAILSALAASAGAAPLLRGDITVTAAIVTVGDLFEDAGLLAETPVFRAPAPGTAGQLTLEDIAAAVRPAGIEDFDPAGLQSIRVARLGAVIDLPMLSDLIARDLRHRGILNDAMAMDIALNRPLPALTATDPGAPAQLAILRYMPGSSTFSARFEVAGSDHPLDIEGQIQLMIEAPHLTRTLPQGAILDASDIEMRMVPLAFAEATGLVAFEAIVGKQLQRQTRAGVMIRPADISAPELISRNDTVTMIYQQGGLTLTATGKALNAAGLNDSVTVLNTMTNKVVLGTATRNGMVLISSGSQQVAGL